VYHENLVINKTLSLLGEDKTSTIIDGNQKWTVVEVVADGVVLNGFTIQNSSRSQGAGGILLNHSSQCNVSGNIIIHNAPAGLTLWNDSHNNLIERNMIAYSGIVLPGWIEGNAIAVIDSNNNTINDNTLMYSINCGIDVENSNNVTIQFNTIKNQNDDVGIRLSYSDNTIIRSNTIEENALGLYLWYSNDSAIFRNIYNNDTVQHVLSEHSVGTVWDDGIQGNYWDNYIGFDDGNDSRVMGDGVGDTDLPHLGIDTYPLVRPPMPIPFVWDSGVYSVEITGNSTVSMVRFVQAEKEITFNVTGPGATAGYCNVTIPKSLLRDSPWTILRNGTDVTFESTVTENGTHSFLYFTYDHTSINNIQIIGTWVVPEFPSEIVPTAMLLLSALIITLRKRRRNCARQSTSSF